MGNVNYKFGIEQIVYWIETLNKPEFRLCNICEGYGAISNDVFICPKCDGVGFINTGKTIINEKIESGTVERIDIAIIKDISGSFRVSKKYIIRNSTILCEKYESDLFETRSEIIIDK